MIWELAGGKEKSAYNILLKSSSWGVEVMKKEKKMC